MNKISISVQMNSCINFALWQNYVPIIRSIIVKNEMDMGLEDVKINISCDPDFIKKYEYVIPFIEKNAVVEITPVDLHLSTEFLFSITEKVRGSVNIEISHQGEVILSQIENVEVLTKEEWGGLHLMPEMVTAFVTPNATEISQILSRASTYLEGWDKSQSFSGYQTNNPNNVKLQMAAIYHAIEELGIVYCNPLASYERQGQRIRLANTIVNEFQATCLDFALFYAGALESCGLNPILVFTKGHAFVGCWLDDETFIDCVIDDISNIKKRMAIGDEQILVLEATAMASGKNISFDEAVNIGKKNMEDEANFVYVIDVARSRAGGVRPISIEAGQQRFRDNIGLNGGETSNAADLADINQPKDLVRIEHELVDDANKKISRMQIWERKLLDLSLRNALLNFRINKNTMQIMADNLGVLEDVLAEGRELKIVEAPNEWDNEIKDAKIYKYDSDLVKNFAAEELKKNRIRSYMKAIDLEESVKSIYRAAKVSIEENGSNTLFLALGFLKWYESNISEKPRYAPLVLVPIEVVRSKRAKGYIIRSRQEETQINITLIEYLKQIHNISIQGLDPLPTDEAGVDLAFIFHTIRNAIMEKNKWNIEEFSVVGLFSFGQFVMWNDLRNRTEEIEQHKVVSSLIEGHLNWQPEALEVSINTIDNLVTPSDMAVPMKTDSSQLFAVLEAAKGQSFVLHGPPGTGKSQTITNMIANALYSGKSVLFVAEKMAALSVVQNRLEEVGIAPFCLELHSNKTNKTSVLASLEEVLNFGRVKNPEDYIKTAEELLKIRNELNYTIEAIHKTRSYGCSLYEAIERYEANSGYKGKIKLNKEIIKNYEAKDIEYLDGLIRNFMVIAKEIGSYENSKYLGYEGLEYSIPLREELLSQLDSLISEKENISNGLEILFDWADLTQDKTKCTIVEICNLLPILEKSANILTKWLEVDNFEWTGRLIDEILRDGYEFKALVDKISSVFDGQIWQYNISQAYLEYKKAMNSWFLPKLLGRNKLIKEINLYAKNEKVVTQDNIESYHKEILRVQELANKLGNINPMIAGVLGGEYLGTQTNWMALRACVEKTRLLSEKLSGVDSVKRIKYIGALQNHENLEKVISNIRLISGYLERLNIASQKFRFNISYSCNDWFEFINKKMQEYVSNIDEMKNWTTLNMSISGLADTELIKVVNEWKNGSFSYQEIKTIFDTNLYYDIALDIITKDERLTTFNGIYQEDLIAKYNEVINKYQELTIQELVARLSAKIPLQSDTNIASSEIGILKKAIKSNGRGMSIRKLFDLIPDLLRKLCPCMLMSPISVAQYIDPKFPKFDLVIFDEASQIQTSTAVGTIARGENVIIVGDPKQLPPTSFFSTTKVDEDDIANEDLESLLDDCLAISMPEDYLKWHYRSRHESLIAYSNAKYYDNKLLTYPSPNDLISEVKLVQVDGYYDKGKTKHNVEEAKAIVNEIIRRLQDKELKNESIGVVTFNSVQQNLIDDLLTEAFAAHPELEDYDKNCEEPVFIKNLENVQGDERDIILFSIGYGPDKEGKVTMNFGPLNRDGGWRRLNVAISRARKGMIVYSTLKPEQIDLSRTRAEGVAGLKGFLEYAARGKDALISNVRDEVKKTDYLIEEISREIEGLGYEVKTNIGTSLYRMDIAIVDKEDENTYKLGILLDGQNSLKAATARDRYVTQPGVLKGLGWKIIRIWALEWLDNKSKVLSDIQLEIEKIDTRVEEVENVEVPKNEQLKKEFVFEKMDMGKLVKNQSREVPYKNKMFTNSYQSEDFYNPTSINKMISMIEEIIEVESPISINVLKKKLINAWGISRSGAQVDNIYERALSASKKQIKSDVYNQFLWKAKENIADYNVYRVYDSEGNKRAIIDIACEEIKNVIKEVMAEVISLDYKDLIRETANRLGFVKVSEQIEEVVGNAIYNSKLDGFVEIDGGKVRYIDKEIFTSIQ